MRLKIVSSTEIIYKKLQKALSKHYSVCEAGGAWSFEPGVQKTDFSKLIIIQHIKKIKNSTSN